MEKMNSTFEEIRKIIEINQSIAISGHTSPDGDAIGACAALGMALQLLGKDVTVILEDYSEVFKVIPTGGLFQTSVDEEFIPDLYITLDCGDKERLGKYAQIFDRTLYTINVDHHISNTYFAKENYVDIAASSASEIVFQLLYGYAPIDVDIATAIYSGIVFDTGGFRHSSTTPITMAIVSELMEYDFDFTSIYNSIFHSRSFGEVKIMGVALASAQEHFDGRLVTAFISKQDMDNCGVTNEDVSEVSSYIKGIRGTQVIAFIYEKGPGVYKVSMRSDDPVDVSKVAMNFGGGGHRLASGCTIEGNVSDVLEQVITEIKKQIEV